MLRVRSILVLACLATAMLVAGPEPALSTSCAEDPDALTTREMIIRGRTGEEPAYPHLVLGRVRAILDVRGSPSRGAALARVAVRASIEPTAGTIRVRFWVPGAGEPITIGEPSYEVGERWVLVLHKHRDGTFSSDEPCGGSWQPWREKFRNLIRLSRRV
jgi:hypothetical protein